MEINLGVIVNSDNKTINHRSLLKVLLNPFLRYFGLQISTKFNTETQELGCPVIMKCPRITDIKCSIRRSWIYRPL